MSTIIDDLIIENSFSANTITATTMVIGSTSISLTNSSFNTLSATTFSGGTIYSGGTDVNTYFNQDRAQISTKANLSGATFTGQINATTLSATTLSAGTIFSGGTSLPTIISSVALGTLLSGYAIATSGTTSGLTSSSSILTGFQNLERLIKNVDFQVISATATTTTTNTTLTDMAGMSATTKDLGQNGFYFIMFNGSCQNSTSNRFIEAEINIDGTSISKSRVSVNSASATAGRANSITLMTVASIAKNKIIKIQWDTESNTASMFERVLTIIGIPNNYIL